MDIGDCLESGADLGELDPVGVIIFLVFVLGLLGFIVYNQMDKNSRAQHIEDTCKLLSAKPLLVIEDGDERTDTRYTYLCKDGTGIQVFDKTKNGNVTFREVEGGTKNLTGEHL